MTLRMSDNGLDLPQLSSNLVILYKTLRAYNVTIKDSFKEKLGKGFFMTVSGSLVVIFLAGICLFATIRINM